MYQVIARKYRPQAFAELIGQEHVRTTLENAISQRRIAHGYIFSGQRGTGKTTVARILARCLNCINGPTATPCGVCASCLEIAGGNSPDVIEIDAASNRGINEMRELRENVRYRPARDRYKVFIVDEAHQITSEAFNALLKTLEEPPEWAVFILCTTEVHKIPTTIASRCQQFSFRSVDFGEVVKRMEEICAKEGIETSPEVLSVLAQAGEGSVRDSLSALDQAIACCGAKLDAAEVRGMLGLFSLDSLGEVTRALKSEDSRKMLDLVMELERNGRSLQHFCRELARYFRNLLVVKVAGANTRLIAASRARAGAAGRGRQRIFRRRSDALFAAHARSVQGPAVFTAAPAASGDWIAPLDSGRQAGCQSRRRWPIWVEAVRLRRPSRKAHHRPRRHQTAAPQIPNPQPPTPVSAPAAASAPSGPWRDRLARRAARSGDANHRRRRGALRR